MNVLSLNAYKQSHLNENNATINKLKEVQRRENLNGLLMNAYIKNKPFEEKNDSDEINFNVSSEQFYPKQTNEASNKKELFDMKNAFKPLALMTVFGIGAIALISLGILKYSKVMAKADGLVRPTDIPRSMNIVQEHQLALYRALRDPNAKNILGLIGVGIMSAFTLCARNFAEGAQEIWIQKQKFDIEHDFQQELIDVEKNSFAGKLSVVNSMYQNTSNYFNSVFNKNKSSNLDFKGNLKEEKNDDEKKKNIKPVLFSLLGILGALGLSFGLYKNYQKTIGNLETFVIRTSDSVIRSDIEKALKLEDKEKAIEVLSNIFKRANIQKEKMTEILNNVKGIEKTDVDKALSNIEKDRIYVEPSEALAGVSKKIQYYCFVDEERGHLYNWILNPENKFNKYLFLTLCATGAIGYLSKLFVDAIKKVAVQKQNTSNELNLRKEMVEVEINNFKAKKEAAITPLIEEFKNNLQKEKDIEKLKQQAQDILVEIKNGPPYVYF